MAGAAIAATAVVKGDDMSDAARKGAVGKDLGKSKVLPSGRYDEHIHIYEDEEPRPDFLAARIAESGLIGGCVYSREQSPEPLYANTTRMSPEQIVDNVIEWCSASPNLFPFYWIDPSRPDSVDLVDMAVEKGICGFKVIRSNGYPCEGYALDAYKRISYHNKPLTFHSGILYDGMVSSEYFRPIAFETMLKVPRIRFALAHVAWPWCDECFAVYGKIRDAGWRLRPRRQGARNTDVPYMFIDTTPGLKGCTRREVFKKIYVDGYADSPTFTSVGDWLMYGTDCSVHNYSVAQNRHIQGFDDALFKEFGVPLERVNAYYRANLQKYLYGGF